MPASPYRSVEEALADPQIGHRGALATVHDAGGEFKVVNAPFRVEPLPKVEPIPFHQQPWVMDLLRAAAAPLALALVGLVVVFKLIRPALNAAMDPVPAPALGRQLDVVADNELAMATPAEFSKQIVDEIAKMKKVAAYARIQID